MSQPVPRDVLSKVRKLTLLPEEVKQSRWATSITRLTSLKSLCKEPEVANRFVTHLARKTLLRVKAGKGRSHQPDGANEKRHRQRMDDALTGMEAWLEKPTDDGRQRLWALLGQIRDEQNEVKWVKSNLVRIIHDTDLLVFEKALSCLLQPEREAGFWAYHTAREYAERYNPSEGTGLISSSVPLVQDIADFWVEELGLDRAALTAPAKPRKAGEEKPATKARKGSAGKE